jgi:hypothetical protein
VLVQLVFQSIVLSALVKNKFVLHSVILSLVPLASDKAQVVAIVAKSQGCTAVAPFSAPALISDKSLMASCFQAIVVSIALILSYTASLEGAIPVTQFQAEP